MAITTSLKLDPETRERLQQLAAARDRKPHYLMREAIRQYIDREEQRERTRQAALAAWHEFQANGLHASSDEADAWLARLEAGEDVDPPECHG